MKRTQRSYSVKSSRERRGRAMTAGARKEKSTSKQKPLSTQQTTEQAPSPCPATLKSDGLFIKWNLSNEAGLLFTLEYEIGTLAKNLNFEPNERLQINLDTASSILTELMDFCHKRLPGFPKAQLRSFASKVP